MNVKERAAHLLLDYAVNLQEAHAPDGKWRGDEAEHSYRNLVETAKGIHHGVHLITEAPIEPDKEGFWIHPGMPDHLDEDPRPFHEWLDEQLLKCATAEVGDENGDLDSDWADTKPEGFGWFLLALMDTEDGPTAFWVRRNQALTDSDTLNALERDALRYRWLRLKDNFPGDEDQERSLWDDLCDQDADEFDAWVDRHMEEDQKEPSDA